MRLVESPPGAMNPNPFWLEGSIERLHIPNTASTGWDDVFDTSCGEITMEPGSFLGHRVMLIAGAHDARQFGWNRMISRVSNRLHIFIREGAWLASGVKVIGPADIGPHAVVTMGTIVRGVVPAFAMIGPGECNDGKSWKIIGDVRKMKPRKE